MSVKGSDASDAGVTGNRPEEPTQRAKLLTLWSWLMLPVLIVSFGVGYPVGIILMGVLDVPEGGLLTEAGLLGWLSTLLVFLIGVAPVAGGTWLGRLAVREGGGGPAISALIVNGLVMAYLVVVQVLQQFLA